MGGVTAAPTVVPGLDELAALVGDGNVVVLSGAGLSTDSGIPDYRGPGSTARAPMTYQEFIATPEARQRYWARSHLGWQRMGRAVPNDGHRALAALDPMRPDVIGLNCATGPSEMGEHLRYLAQHSRIPISVLPNAGLPSVVDGKMHYDLTAEEFTKYQARFVREFGVRVVGGCCGTTPEYIRQLAEAGLQLPGAVLELGQAAVELGRAGAQLLEAVREPPGAVGEGVGPVLRRTDPALQLLRARGHGVGAVVEVRQIRLGGGGDVVLDEALDALVGGRGGRGGLLGAAGDVVQVEPHRPQKLPRPPPVPRFQLGQDATQVGEFAHGLGVEHIASDPVERLQVA